MTVEWAPSSDDVDDEDVDRFIAQVPHLNGLVPSVCRCDAASYRHLTGTVPNSGVTACFIVQMAPRKITVLRFVSPPRE